jgi:xylulokinase
MILVIDLGTQSFRATLVDRGGRMREVYGTPVGTRREGLIAEQDPRVWRTALREAVERVRGEDVRAVTATATLSGLVALDEQGEPLRPAVMYGDRRPAAMLAGIDAGPYFRAYSGDFLPQLHWLRAEEPETFARARHLLDATGYLNYLLTGEATLDRYTTFTCYELPLDDFPQTGRVVEAGAVIGPARELGGAPVISVSYDSAAAYLGTALTQAGEALDISGTVTSFGVLTERRVVDGAKRIFSIPYRGRWLARGSTALSGPVLDWARGLLGEADWEAARPGAGGVTFLPFLAGARTPLWEPAATGSFHGLTLGTGRPEMLRAVYEGVCFALRHIVDTIEECGGRVERVQLGGGLARNAALNQLKADVLGRPVRAQVSTEVTTLGSATVAARHLRWLGAEDSYCVAGGEVEPRQADRYEEAYGRYRAAVEKLYGKTPMP